MPSQSHPFAVVLPVGPTLGVAPKSGMVARCTDHGIVVDFEGGIYGQINLVTYADRVAVAAGRAAADYPTAARRYVADTDVVDVGVFDPLMGTIEVDEGMRDALARWLEVPVEDLEPQLVTTDLTSVDVRTVAAWSAHQRAANRPVLRALPASVRTRLSAAGLL